MATALCSAVFSPSRKDVSLLVVVVLLVSNTQPPSISSDFVLTQYQVTLASMPVMFLQVLETFPTAHSYLGTELVLFTCWYLPEVALLGSLWYAMHCHIWTCDDGESCLECIELDGHIVDEEKRWAESNGQRSDLGTKTDAPRMKPAQNSIS